MKLFLVWCSGGVYDDYSSVLRFVSEDKGVAERYAAAKNEASTDTSADKDVWEVEEVTTNEEL